jgi:hypothetical protein
LPRWFLASHKGNDKQYHRVREFLVKFELERRENREMIAQDPNSREIDAELTKYDRFNRSPDDSESYRVRYEILKNGFRRAIAKAT